MKVLIVNDEMFTAETMKEEVDWASCGIEEVFTAYDAEGAREIIAAQKPDILLCDIEMPGENGLQLMHWVRENGYESECIFLTCHASFSYAQEAIRLNCQDYILMPAREEEIVEGLKKAVRRIRDRKDSDQLEKYGARWVESQKKEIQEGLGRKSTQEILSDCVRFIHENLQDSSLSVNMVADFCHLNPVYLNRLFKREKNTSVGQLIIQERMELAARLLADPNLSANAVAERTGYVNYSYFSASFKKYFGCSPQNYAERRKGQK